MKKRVISAAALTAAVIVSGSCVNTEKADKIIASSTQTSAQTETTTKETTAEAPTGAASDASVDIDLTAMSGTMVYAEVYNIMSDPESYYGKSIKVSGYFDSGYDPTLDTRYYFVVIPDAAACCMQGMEFILKDTGLNYPDDYPELKDDIQIVGTLDKYDENGNTFYYISADELVRV